MRLAATLLVSFVAVGCRPATTSDSTVKHTLGETKRPALIPLQNCDHAEGAELPKAKTYLDAIFQTIVGANQQTFTGDLAASEFCVSAVKDTELNAYAEPIKRRIKFHSQMLLEAKSDADVAAVMAHELAHVTMRHSAGGSPTGQDQQAFAARTERRNQVFEEHSAKVDQINAMVKSISEEFKARITAYMESGADGAAALEELVALRSKVLTMVRPAVDGDLIDPVIATAVATTPGTKLMTYVEALGWTFAVQELTDEGKSTYMDFEAKRAAAKKAIGSIRSSEENIAYEQRESALKSLRAANDVLLKELSALNEQLQAMLSVNMTPEQVVNWSEQEADEVGYEFFLRSGFKTTSYGWVESSVSGAKDTGSALRACLAARDGGEPLRGALSHPAPCWRLWNIAIKENRLHLRDYAPFITGNQVENMNLTVTLKDAQEELRGEPLASTAGN